MSRPQQGINMMVRFKGKILTEMMTTFEAALSVNLTTMLVTTAIFISKMEGGGLAPHLGHQDDWLLSDPLQLVPFAQVVLLTAKENLREEEQDSLDKDDIHPPTPTNHNTEITAEDETMPKEAWTISQGTFSKRSSLTILAIIGKVLITFST